MAAGGATQRLPAGAAGSLARWQVASRRAIIVAEPRVPPTATGSAVPSSVVMQDTRMPTAPCGRPVRVLRQRSRVQRPPVQRPPVQRPRVRCPRVWCPMPGVRVRCPEPRVRRRMSGVRCERPASVRVASVSALFAPVGSWSARVRRAATRLGIGRVGVSPLCRAAGVRGSPTAAGCVQVSRSVLPARGRPRPESLSRWPSALGGPWPTARACAAPPQPKAAGGPSTAGRPGGKLGLTWENRGGLPGLESGTILIRDDQVLIVISRNVDNALLSWAFSTRWLPLLTVGF